jgi:capsular polysaccharide biosynthesis protein
METLIEILGIVGRRKRVIIVTTLVTCAVVIAGTFMMPPMYSAATTLRVAQARGGSIDYVDYRYAERLINTHVEILRSRPVLEETIRRLDLHMMPKDLAARTKVEALPDTELIRITVEDSNPWRARDIANTLAALLMEQSQSL